MWGLVRRGWGGGTGEWELERSGGRREALCLNWHSDWLTLSATSPVKNRRLSRASSRWPQDVGYISWDADLGVVCPVTDWVWHVAILTGETPGRLVSWSAFEEFGSGDFLLSANFNLRVALVTALHTEQSKEKGKNKLSNQARVQLILGLVLCFAFRKLHCQLPSLEYNWVGKKERKKEGKELKEGRKERGRKLQY